MRGECIPQSCSVFDGIELTEGIHRNGFLPFYTIRMLQDSSELSLRGALSFAKVQLKSAVTRVSVAKACQHGAGVVARG
jgi:hypothetical protein